MKKTYEYMIKTTGEPYGKKVRAGYCFCSPARGDAPGFGILPLRGFCGL